MKDHIKTDEEIAGIREAAKVASQTLEMIGDHVQPGITTGELDRICHDFILEQGATPTSLGYEGFPKAVCISVNHVICHGIPGDKKLKNGDIINIDVATTKNGYIGDTSKMFTVGKASILGKRLCEETYQAMFAGIKVVKPGVDIAEPGRAIERYINDRQLPYGVVREYCGHGVGVEFHEPLQIIHFGLKSDVGIQFQPGMVFTVEPMINAGKPDTKTLPDNWTVVTKDHSLSAQWEHTILVTEDGFEILTTREEENNGGG